jgi:hypothetical protein
VAIAVIIFAGDLEILVDVVNPFVMDLVDV